MVQEVISKPDLAVESRGSQPVGLSSIYAKWIVGNVEIGKQFEVPIVSHSYEKIHAFRDLSQVL